MRIKRGVTKRRKHKKILNLAKGYRMTRHSVLSVAHEAVHHAGAYAFNDRRKKRGNFRSLWITRINAALGDTMSYSQFVSGLKSRNIQLDRKMLANLALNEPQVFEYIIKQVK